jgi:hypothetical protein
MLRVVALLMLLSTRAMADLPERWIATAIDVPNTIDVAVADLDDEDRVCGWVRVMVDGAPVNKPFFWHDGVATVEDTGLDDAHSYLLDPTGRAFGIAHDPNLLIRVWRGLQRGPSCGPDGSASRAYGVGFLRLNRRGHFTLGHCVNAITMTPSTMKGPAQHQRCSGA